MPSITRRHTMLLPLAATSSLRMMKKLGRKQLTLQLQEPLAGIPAALQHWPLKLSGDGHELEYSFDANAEHTGIDDLLRNVGELGIDYRDLRTRQSSLEEIFVSLIKERA